MKKNKISSDHHSKFFFCLKCGLNRHSTDYKVGEDEKTKRVEFCIPMDTLLNPRLVFPKLHFAKAVWSEEQPNMRQDIYVD